MQATFLDFFTDPVLRGPTIGCMLMCLAAALCGVVVFLRRQSLVGEALSHAAYPGVVLGIAIASALSYDDSDELLIAAFVLGGAFISALIGLWTIGLLERYFKVKSDAALCFVLSAFFGVGIALASHIQFVDAVLFRQVQAYLFGQAATMGDVHIKIYGILCIFIISAISLLYKELQAITFDVSYAKSLGIPTKAINTCVFVLIVLAVVIGIRSVGVVLMSAMLIAPASAARQFSNRLYIIFPLAGLFGLISGFLGNYLSIKASEMMQANNPGLRLSLPTGPMIVIIATAICLFALFFAPKRGLIVRALRIARFRFKTLCENVMKTIWRLNGSSDVFLKDITKYQSASPIYLKFILANLVYNGWLKKEAAGSYSMTHEGKLWGAKIVRLHRLWEVYLVDYLGVGCERVHKSAEEMEHILTPELESELTLLLKDPKKDPHQQPIPPKKEF